MSLAVDDPRHGTLNGYTNLKCRCSPCRTARNDYAQKLRGAAGKPVGAATDFNACGNGTPWGCREVVSYPARLLLNGCRGARETNHVLFHPDCWPDIATVPAFSKGLAKEEARP